MAIHLTYTFDVVDSEGQQVYDAIVKSAPVELLSPVRSGEKFTRIEVLMRSGLPLEHEDGKPIPPDPLD